MTSDSSRLANTAIVVALALCGCQSTAQVTKSPESPGSSAPAAPKATPEMPSPSTSMQPMMGGWHHHSPYGQLYSQGKAVTLEGEIVKTTPIMPLPHMMQGIQLILKTREGEKAIHLGPAWFIEQQEFTLSPGEKIKVEGRTVDVAGQKVVIANSLQKGSESLVLRDATGFPFWAGGRMMYQHKGRSKTPSRP
ncbi:MAG: hypothetical protein RI932_648 [Pseudomonadota bacterium]|jgi:hypothetical protein